jgi:hypothetical protein
MRAPAFASCIIAFAVAACAQDDDSKSPQYAGTLDVDVTHAADVVVDARAAGAASVRVTFKDSGFGLADPGATLSAEGRIEAFPEAGLSLVTARFALPARTDSPCGAEPISLMLSLSRRGENKRVGGGMTAYCGRDLAYGTPARVLRITGDLPRRGL